MSTTIDQPAAPTADENETPASDSRVQCTITPLQTLQGQLKRFRQSGSDPNQYMASCPGPLHKHGDRNPSLSIYEQADGTLLINCQVGCSYEEVMHAAGLEVKDLYPADLRIAYQKAQDSNNQGKRLQTQRPRYDYKALIESLDHETLIVTTAARKVLDTDLTPEDRQRLELATQRISRIALIVEGVE